jgi:small subunit ribosomal protein S16
LVSGKRCAASGLDRSLTAFPLTHNRKRSEQDMPTRIRLRRTGRKGQGYFRIVVAHQEMARDGRVVATLGHYNPRSNPAVIEVDVEQARAWLNKGATPTDTVRSLLRRAGVLSRAAGAPEGSAAAVPPAAGAPPVGE